MSSKVPKSIEVIGSAWFTFARNHSTDLEEEEAFAVFCRERIGGEVGLDDPLDRLSLENLEALAGDFRRRPAIAANQGTFLKRVVADIRAEMARLEGELHALT